IAPRTAPALVRALCSRASNPFEPVTLLYIFFLTTSRPYATLICKIGRPSDKGDGGQFEESKSRPVTTFRMNTCKSVSKQRTLTTFRMNTCEKYGGGALLDGGTDRAHP